MLRQQYHSQRQCLRLGPEQTPKPDLCKTIARYRLRSGPQASRNSSSVAEQAAVAGGQPAAVQLSSLIPQQAVALFSSGAVLGPFCDGLHSQHDVLHYTDPSMLLQLHAGEECRPPHSTTANAVLLAVSQ